MFICVCVLVRDFNCMPLQHQSHVARGEEPAELPGAAVREVGGELVRGGRPALLHGVGHAHPAARALEGPAPRLPAPPARRSTRPQGLPHGGQQVSDGRGGVGVVVQHASYAFRCCQGLGFSSGPL